MIEHGPDIQSQIKNEATSSDLAISQIIQYNCHQSKKKEELLQLNIIPNIVRHLLLFMLGFCCLSRQENVN